MKVVQVNSVFGKGSTGRIVSDLHKEAIYKGYESYVFYGRGNRFKKHNVSKINTSVGVLWHVLLSRLFDYQGLSSTLETIKLVNKLSKIKPDIIHLHNIHGYYINYKILFKYLYKFEGQVIWTLHDSWSYTGHCAYYTFSGCNKWEKGCSKCPQMKSYPKSFIDRSKSNYKLKMNLFTQVKNMTLVTPSKWLNQEIKQSFLSIHKIITINNGVDQSVFQARNTSLRTDYDLNDKYIILGVANVWDNRKGLDFFIELEDYIDADERIILIGLNEKQLNLLENLKSNIIGLKRTESSNQLAEFYSIADVYVNPTLEDNYPTTNLEAISCNLPVITFNTGGSPEALFTSGIVTDDKTTQSIYEAIKKIRHNKITLTFDNKERIGKDVFVEKYMQLYNEVTK